MGVLTLDLIRREAAPELYPRHVLVGCQSALVLFAAAFHGKQDCVWMADAGLTATCVDLDADKLAEMAYAYPTDWWFVAADVFEYAVEARGQWDVVSIDCPSNLFGRCAELLPLWCLLARRAVVLGTGLATTVEAPSGWRVTDVLQRSGFLGGVYWTVLEPA